MNFLLGSTSKPTTIASATGITELNLKGNSVCPYNGKTYDFSNLADDEIRFYKHKMEVLHLIN
jgi:hypothetical protein